jgi:hypothetical protein
MLQEADITIADDVRDASVCHEAALEYHEARGNRVSIAPYTPEAIARLRRLMDDSVSLDRAWHELNIRNRPAASATLEALVFSLRRGVQELLQPDTRRRLSELAEDQVEAVCHRIQNFKPAIAPAWPSDDVGLLISAWGRRHE